MTVAIAYTFGLRKSTLLDMTVDQVGLVGQTIRLWRGATKNGEPRLVKMTREVLVLLTACVLNKQPDHFVFSRNRDTPILDFRGRWDALGKVPGQEWATVLRHAPFRDSQHGAAWCAGMRSDGDQWA